MFIGREWELSQLEQLWQQNKYQLFIMYGRRRIGKTALLREFCKDKPHIFFSAEQSNEYMNMEKFSQIVYEYYGEDSAGSFDSLEKGLRYIKNHQNDKSIVVVLDEFPYLALSNMTMLSALQHLIDNEIHHSKIFLVLCGSYMSFMEREILGTKSPLFGRRTAQLKLKPFDYYDSAKFLDGFSDEDKLILYSVFGGTPMYLSQIRKDYSVAENVKELFLNPVGYLHEEAIMLLRQEVKEPAVYSGILEAIAGGASRANEIATKTGEETAKCLKYVKVLEELGLIIRSVPIGEKINSRKTIYSISDPMFRFWYRYIPKYRSLLETSGYDIIWSRRIAPDLSNYMGSMFERICHEFVIKKNLKGELPLLFSEIGHWWGTDSKTRQQEEIDLVARDGNEYLIGECKWRNEPLDSKVLEKLQYRAKLITDQNSDVWYILFSKSGFTDNVKKATIDNDKIILVTLSDFW